VEVNRSYHAYRLSMEDEVVRIAVAAARKAGIEPDLHQTGGGSDASVFNARGLPATVIGVGYENPHSTDEKIAIADLVRSTEMAVAIVQVAAQG
jgi:tripeptide aminopeptidase